MTHLAPKVLAAMKEQPAFRAYKRSLLGCCRHPRDAVLRKKLISFSLQNPKFQPIITGILADA